VCPRIAKALCFQEMGSDKQEVQDPEDGVLPTVKYEYLIILMLQFVTVHLTIFYHDI
jgi:hypothetical protein